MSVHYTAVGHVGVFETMFKCQTLCTFLYPEFSCTFAAWVDQDYNTVKSDSVKNVIHRTEKVAKGQKKIIYMTGK